MSPVRVASSSSVIPLSSRSRLRRQKAWDWAGAAGLFIQNTLCPICPFVSISCPATPGQLGSFSQRYRYFSMKTLDTLIMIGHPVSYRTFHLAMNFFRLTLCPDRTGETMRTLYWMKFVFVVAAGFLHSTTVFAATSAAQTYPFKAIRIIVPYPPGGGADATARPLAQTLGEHWGQSVIIENRGGASGMIGAEHSRQGAARRLHHHGRAPRPNPRSTSCSTRRCRTTRSGISRRSRWRR